MRAVLDPNVWVAALLSPNEAPARIVQSWREGAFDVVVSPLLLDELARVLAYAKIRARVPAVEAVAIVSLVRLEGLLVPDPEGPPSVRCADPDDDYMLALAEAHDARLVSGDRQLLALHPPYPVHAPAEFLRLLKDELG